MNKKNLIDDMISRVECYNMLLNESALPNKLKTAQFLFFYNSMIYLGYQHPRALMFKALCQYKETKINDIAIKSIVRNSLVFMITFQTINNRDSKDAIPVFEKIMTDDYGVDSLDITKIKTTFSNRLATEGITEDSLHTRIKEYKGYAKQDKSETIVLLAFYESLTDGKVSYDNANIIIKNRLMFAIDHILPQHPDEKNIDFKYYCGKNKNEIIMVTEAGFAPYEYYENGEIVGVDVAIAKEIAKELGKKLVVKNVDFDSIVSELKSGKADFAAAGMSITEERKKQVDFTIEYVTSNQVVVVKKDSSLNDITQLDGKRIAVQLGTVGDSCNRKLQKF